MSNRVVLKTIIKFKRGQASTWRKLNPILEQGEPGVELDTLRMKVGDGLTPWIDLPYWNGEIAPAVDGKSIVILDDGHISLNGFVEASTGQIPSKGEDGEIKWIESVDIEAMSEADIRDICK